MRKISKNVLLPEDRAALLLHDSVAWFCCHLSVTCSNGILSSMDNKSSAFVSKIMYCYMKKLQSSGGGNKNIAMVSVLEI